MSRLAAIIQAIRRRLRSMAGLEPGEQMHLLLIALYSLLALIAIALVLAWLTVPR